jgi:hypothetical protein
MRESTPRLYHCKNQCFAALSYSKKEPLDKGPLIGSYPKPKELVLTSVGRYSSFNENDAFGSS